MLKSRLIHPRINEVLARAGHHAKVLIADGHYPASTAIGPNAELVSLNLSPGIVSATDVLRALLSAAPFDFAHPMGYETTGPYALTSDPPIWDEFRQIFREEKVDLKWQPIEKWEFYKQVSGPDHVLTIQTGDIRRFANLLLVIGVRMDF